MENKYIIKFKKTFNFEGKSYSEIDLSGVENLTGKDLKEVERELPVGTMPLLNEYRMDFVQPLAAKITGYPIEFFEQMPAKDCLQINDFFTAYWREEETEAEDGHLKN